METISKATPIKTSYNYLIGMIEKEKFINIAKISEVISNMVSEASNDSFYPYDNDQEDYETSINYKLANLASFFLDDNYQYSGRSDDFHNLAVDYARQEMYREACIVLERGIKLRQASIDLLADFIAYGRNIPSLKSQCKKYYNQLDSLPRSKWNWRAYTFSIDYLLEERDYAETIDEENKIMEKSIEIAKEFIEKYNSLGSDCEHIDTAYTDLANVYTVFGDVRSARNILKKCADKYSRTPRASMKLAQIEFNAGRYEEASELLSKCVACMELQQSVNKGYIFLLRAYSNASMFFMSQINKNDNSVSNDDIISRIRKDLDTAESLKSGRIYGDEEITRLRDILDNQCPDASSLYEGKW